MISEKSLKKLAIEYPFSYYEIKEVQCILKCNLKELESILDVSIKCNVSFDEIYTLLANLNTFKLNPIPEHIFYNKELSDAIRDIVVKSPCTYENAVKLMNNSKNYTRDVHVIKGLLSVGISFKIVERIIINLNTE